MQKHFEKKALSSFLCALSLISFVSIGQIDKNLTVVSQAENSLAVGALAPGKYVAALYRSSSYNEKLTSSNAPNKFYGQAVLTVTEEQKQYLTIGVQNWSFYDAFINLNQNYNSLGTNYVPERLLDEKELTDEENFRGSYSEQILSTTEENYDYYNYNVEVTEYDAKLDTAYITFEIQDYTQPIVYIGWTNVPLSSMASSVQYRDAEMIWLKQDTLYSVDSIKEAIDNNTPKYALRQATADSSPGHYNTNYSGASAVFSLFKSDSFSVKKESNGTYTTKIYINYEDEYYTRYEKPRDFKIVTAKKYDYYTVKDYTAWQTYTGNNSDPITSDNTTIFEEVAVNSDNDGFYITLNYTEQELLFGKYLWYNTLFTSKTGTKTDKSMYCSPCITLSEPIEQITVTSEDEKYQFIKVNTNTSVMPKGTTLEVIENSSDTDYGYSSKLYVDSKWYTLYLKYNGERIEPNGNVTVEIEIPDGLEANNSYLELRNNNGTRVSANANLETIDFEKKTWVRSGVSINGATFSFCKLNDVVNPSEFSDGIYNVNIYLTKSSASKGTPSMANNALVHDAYIVKNGEKTVLYFKACSMDYEGEAGLYIGELHCAGFTDNTKYTEFLLDSKGNLVDNAGYNAITEYACILGGIIDLEPSCWNSEKCAYNMTVASPMMARLAGSSYEDIKDNELGVCLTFTNPDRLYDATDENVQKYILDNGYDYTESAVIRQREIAKLKATEVEEYEGLYEYSKSAVYNLKKAIADADKATDSASYEKAIKALKTATEKAEPMTTSSIVNGYTLGLQDDFSLSFCMDFKSATVANLDAGTNTLQIVLPDGETVPVDFSKAEYVEGQGYKLTADIAAKDVSQNATVQLLDKDGNVVDEYSYSVADYAEKLISTTDSDSTKELAQAMLNYGAYAQEYFGVSGTATADSEPLKAVTADNVAQYKQKITDNNADVDFAGAVLSLKSNTNLKVFFAPADGAKLDKSKFKVNGKATDKVYEIDGEYCVLISDINPKSLSETYKITIDGLEVDYSPYSYVYAALTTSDKESLQNVAKALYVYGESAKAYANS